MPHIAKNQQGFAALEVLLIGVVVVLIGGVGYYVYSQRQTTHNAETQNQEVQPAETLPTKLDDTVSFEDAQKVAQAKVTDDKVASTELQSEGGKLVFKVQFLKGKVLVVDAKTGAVIGTQNAAVQQADALASSNNVLTVTQILAKANVKDVRSVALRNKDGKLVYVIKYGHGGEVTLDATTGDTIKSKPAATNGQDKKTDNSSKKAPSSSGNSSSSSSSNSTETENKQSTSNTTTESETESHGGNSGSGGGSGSNSGSSH